MTNKKTPTKRLQKTKPLRLQSLQTENEFRKIVSISGCSERIADELLKWYTI
jgi:hypothetical protein